MQESDGKIPIILTKIKRNSNGIVSGEGIVVSELTTKKKVKFATQSRYCRWNIGEWMEELAQGKYPEVNMDTYYITEIS